MKLLIVIIFSLTLLSCSKGECVTCEQTQFVNNRTVSQSWTMCEKDYDNKDDYIKQQKGWEAEGHTCTVD